MGHIRGMEDLRTIKERATRENALGSPANKVQITVHLGTCGIAAGGDAVYQVIQDEVARSGRNDIRVVVSGCAGMCSSEPNVTVARAGEDGVIYQNLTAEKMRQIFQGHVLNGEVQTDLAMARIRQAA